MESTPEPEDVSNYEGGLKASALGGRVSIEAAIFSMIRDGIVTTVRQGPFFIDTNAGEHKYRGVETGVSWLATTKLSAYLNAAWYTNRLATS